MKCLILSIMLFSIGTNAQIIDSSIGTSKSRTITLTFEVNRVDNIEVSQKAENPITDDYIRELIPWLTI